MRPCMRPGVSILAAWIVTSVLAAGALAETSGPLSRLDIESDGGGVHSLGVIWLPAAPETVRAILTDYEHWPELFPGRFEVVSIQREADRVVTELRINRWPLPGTLQLVCETRVSADGSVVTSLVRGDFQRYRRAWTLRPEERDGRAGTRGEVDLRFELTSWVPAWVVTQTLRGQLEEHFQVLAARVSAANAPDGQRRGN